MEQDPTDPTGVRETSSSTQVATLLAREQKADMAIELYIDRNRDLDMVARKCGYPSRVDALRAIERRMAQLLAENPRNQALMRDMASRRLEALSRSVWKKATNPKDPEHLQAHARAESVVMNWVKLNGVAAPQQVVVSNPTSEAIEAIAAEIAARGAKQLAEGDIFADDADDSEVRALQARAEEAQNRDIVDAEVLEDQEGTDG
jgi:hypothetical protein